MPASLLIVLIIGDPRADWVDGLRRALSGTLDPSVHVEVSPQSSARELQASLERLGGDATLTLAAVELHHPAPRARLRLRAAHSSQWVTRELSFQPSDEEAERGRALGFLLSSMAPELKAAPVSAPPPQPAPVTPSQAHVLPQPAEPPPVAVAERERSPTAPEPVPAPAPEPAAPPEKPVPAPQTARAVEPEAPPAPRRWSVGLAGLGTWGLGRTSPDGGALISAQVRLARFALRLGGTFTRGAVTQAHAAATTTGPFVGGAFYFLDAGVQVSARVDVAAAWFALTTDDAIQSRWALTFRPRLDLAVAISGPFAGFAALGADVWVGGTRVHVKAQEVAFLSPVATAAELGLRVSF